jgi:hypothetical protein
VRTGVDGWPCVEEGWKNSPVANPRGELAANMSSCCKLKSPVESGAGAGETRGLPWWVLCRAGQGPGEWEQECQVPGVPESLGSIPGLRPLVGQRYSSQEDRLENDGVRRGWLTDVRLGG